MRGVTTDVDDDGHGERAGGNESYNSLTERKGWKGKLEKGFVREGSVKKMILIGASVKNLTACCTDGINAAPAMTPISSISSHPVLPLLILFSRILSHSIQFDFIVYYFIVFHPVLSFSTCCVLGVLYCPCRGRGVRGILNSRWLLC